MFDQRANEDEALRKWKVQLEQYERMLAQPNCNYALPHVRRWIADKQHLQVKIAEVEDKHAREDGIPVANKQLSEPAVQAMPTAEAPKGFVGLGKKKRELLLGSVKLTDRQHDCLSMRIEYELGVTEIARRLNIDRKTVYEHLDKANKRLERDQNYRRRLKQSAARRGSHDESD